MKIFILSSLVILVSLKAAALPTRSTVMGIYKEIQELSFKSPTPRIEVGSLLTKYAELDRELDSALSINHTTPDLIDYIHAKRMLPEIMQDEFWSGISRGLSSNDVEVRIEAIKAMSGRTNIPERIWSSLTPLIKDVYTSGYAVDIITQSKTANLSNETWKGLFNSLSTLETLNAKRADRLDLALTTMLFKTKTSLEIEEIAPKHEFRYIKILKSQSATIDVDRIIQAFESLVAFEPNDLTMSIAMEGVAKFFESIDYGKKLGRTADISNGANEKSLRLMDSVIKLGSPFEIPLFTKFLVGTEKIENEAFVSTVAQALRAKVYHEMSSSLRVFNGVFSSLNENTRGATLKALLSNSSEQRFGFNVKQMFTDLIISNSTSIDWKAIYSAINFIDPKDQTLAIQFDKDFSSRMPRETLLSEDVRLERQKLFLETLRSPNQVVAVSKEYALKHLGEMGVSRRIMRDAIYYARVSIGYNFKFGASQMHRLPNEKTKNVEASRGLVDLVVQYASPKDQETFFAELTHDMKSSAKMGSPLEDYIKDVHKPCAFRLMNLFRVVD